MPSGRERIEPMAIEVLMPAMSASVRAGRLVRWLVAVGDVVRPGDVLAEIETEMATMEVEAVDGGRIARILVAAGVDLVSADTPLALLEPNGAEMRASLSGQVAASARRGRVPPLRRILASPLARKRARAIGVALEDLDGSGPGGRIIARDVEAREAEERAADTVLQSEGSARAGGRQRQTSVVAMRPLLDDDVESRSLTFAGMGHRETTYPTSQHGNEIDDVSLAQRAYAPGSYVALAHDPRRQVVCDRVAMAHAVVPQLTLDTDVRVDEMVRALDRLNLGGSGRSVLSLSVSDVLVKAMGLALRQVPEANVSFTRSAMLHHGVVDVAVGLLPNPQEASVCVEVGDDPSTHAPVIAHADLKSLSEISDELQSLRELAWAGRLDSAACFGGVSTIFDFSRSIVTGCQTLVLPPQSSALVLGARQARVHVVDGAVSVYNCARLSLSVDQRAIDPRCALRLLGAVRAFLEDPMRMLV